ncbi:hypothetical protein HPB47_023559 [Ixodes persulcatus]|uniref:Uncharacterized protein n=1 Tax=Ixodes persulcatus TaxID=34615 RepID=A0AC60Q752_IXOPE|nr:hypothetical protein HPB47_023559 [Ixodes persulcatus]
MKPLSRKRPTSPQNRVTKSRKQLGKKKKTSPNVLDVGEAIRLSSLEQQHSSARPSASQKRLPLCFTVLARPKLGPTSRDEGQAAKRQPSSGPLLEVTWRALPN